ncbi:MAG: hypothetical protein KAT91_04320, partial [Candidatus Aenigmarchaeota archaeon]|nr:hypothetical protein [Candidatus Aenigmarchaeota archaeon]
MKNHQNFGMRLCFQTLKENKILFVIFLLAFILRMMFFDTSYVIWDESIYLMHGELFAGVDVGYDETFLRPPLLPFL